MNRRATLADTLTALADGATPLHDMLHIAEAELSLPLIIRMERGPDGPLFFAQPPWSAFRSGVEPITHRMRFSLQATPLLYPTDPVE
jgi:hypothetical protein